MLAMERNWHLSLITFTTRGQWSIRSSRLLFPKASIPMSGVASPGVPIVGAADCGRDRLVIDEDKLLRVVRTVAVEGLEAGA